MSERQSIQVPPVIDTTPKVAVLKTEGINCDEEMVHAFELAGGKAQLVHINELRSGKEQLANYQILAIPGGFSYGDDIQSGKVLALELNSYLADQIDHFVRGQGGIVLGVCNGDQVLMRTGLLPFGTIGEMQASLTDNASGHFECRWINLKVEPNSKSPFVKDMPSLITLPVAHGEGRFVADPTTLEKVEQGGLVVMRYANIHGTTTQEYPQNPSGSTNAIAAICDPTGNILGIMPHPERHVSILQNPNWRRQPNPHANGLRLFENMVEYAKGK